MATDLSDDNVLGKFDQLLDMGIIHYGVSKVVSLVDEGFQIDFLVCPGWSKKPMTVGDALSTHQKDEEPETFGPGSDIYKSHPDQVIGRINDTHLLALNIYPAFRPQYLLLTLDSYRSQNEPLDLQDIEASWKFLHDVRQPHLVMYNCTMDSGCSRYHKHMQMLKKPEVTEVGANGFRFFPDIRNQKLQVPYVYFLHYLDSVGQKSSMDGTAVFDVYLDLLNQCRKSLEIDNDDSKSLCPHNVVLVKEWMILIPRRSGSYKGLSGNSMAMMGLQAVLSEEVLNIWTEIGPTKVLKELGIPRDVLQGG